MTPTVRSRPAEVVREAGAKRDRILVTPIPGSPARTWEQLCHATLGRSAEISGVFIVDHQLQRGNPPDAPQRVPSVERVTTLTGRPPATVVADRGFGTAANDRALQELGVRRIGLQRAGKPGKARCEDERSRSFRRMRNRRVGIEARISHLKRTFGLRRTRLRRLEGAQTWTGLGIFAYNLQRMAAISR